VIIYARLEEEMGKSGGKERARRRALVEVDKEFRGDARRG